MYRVTGTYVVDGEERPFEVVVDALMPHHVDPLVRDALLPEIPAGEVIPPELPASPQDVPGLEEAPRTAEEAEARDAAFFQHRDALELTAQYEAEARLRDAITIESVEPVLPDEAA